MSAKLPAELTRLLARQQSDWQRGIRTPVEQLAGELPTTVDRDEALLELICQERALREDSGEAPQLSDYLQRFPELAESLRIQWEVDRWLSDRSESTNIDSSANMSTHETPLDLRQNSVQGKTCGRYDLIREVGRGAVGIVYEAWDPQLKRSVVVKRLRAGIDADRSHLERAMIEAESVAKIQHAHVVQIFDVGIDHGTPFLAMEYCRGGNLAERLRQGALDARHSAELMLKVTRGIGKAHEARVIHRDLKPGNILLTHPDGWEPKITDFNLAKQLDDESGATATGNILGTPAYMAPEQARGESRQVGPAADVYALGAILYECLTGRAPFRGVTVTETLDLVRHAQPLSVRLLQSSVPRDLATICHKCLEKEPWRRYRSAAELADDLQRYLAGRSIVARPVGWTGKTWRWSLRNPVLASLLTAMAVLISIIAIGLPIAALRLQRERNASRFAEQEALASDDARRQELARVYIADARTVSTTAEADQRQAGLQAVRNALSIVPWAELSPERRAELVDAAIPSLALAELRELQRFPFEQVRFNCLPFLDVDLDFQTLAKCSDDRRGTDLIDARSGTVIQTYKVDGPPPTLPRVHGRSDGGKWIFEYRFDPGRLIVWNRGTGKIALDKAGIRMCPAFHPNDQYILYLNDNRQLELVDLESANTISTSLSRFRAAQAAFSPDGQLIAVTGLDMPAEILKNSNWQSVASFPQLGGTLAVTWHPREPRVFLGTLDGRIVSSDQRQGWKLQPIAPQHDGSIERIIVSPDARYLAASDQHSILTITHLEQKHVVTRLDGFPIRFSGDSRLIAVAGLVSEQPGDHLRILELIEPPVKRTLSLQNDLPPNPEIKQFWSAEFSADGRQLAVALDHSVRLIDAQTLQPIVDLGLDMCGPVAFQPQGSSFVTVGKFSHAWRWPITATQLGPPVPALSHRPRWSSAIPAPHHDGRYAVWSANGEKLAVCDYRRDQVFVHDEATGNELVLPQIHSPFQLALSPDGRWLAVRDRIDAKLMVWDTRDGSLAFESHDYFVPAFSADGSLLAVRNTRHLQLLQVGTWQPLWDLQLGSRDLITAVPVEFQPQGPLLAVANAAGSLWLYDGSAGKRIITLDDRNSRPIEWLSFSPDGVQLAVTRRGTVSIWDLRALETELKKIGLHADGLSVRTSPSTPPTTSSALNPVIVDRGALPNGGDWYKFEQRLARSEARERRWTDAIDDMNKALFQISADDTARRAEVLAERGRYFHRNLSYDAASQDWLEAIELDPMNHEAVIGLARLYVLGPQHLRHPQQAIGLAATILGEPTIERQARLISAIARVQLRQTTSADRDVFDAMIADETSDNIEWRILAMYSRAGDQLSVAETELAQRTLATATAMTEQHRSQLNADLLQEIEMLLAMIRQMR